MMNRTLAKIFICKKCILNFSSVELQIGHQLSLRSHLTTSRLSRHPLHVLTSSKLPIRQSSSETSSLQAKKIDHEPIKFSSEDFKFIEINVKKELETTHKGLTDASQYYFDGNGKYIRPMIAILMARACNQNHEDLTRDQKEVAVITEMIHTASLVHDDVIDASNLRRGKHTAHFLWGQKKAVMAGNYILSTASRKLARIGNDEVVRTLSAVLEDLVSGELMQLGSKESESERFNHYMKKTYNKTASLIANSCKAVAILSDNSSPELKEIAFQYGRNVGIAFQLIDDYLDFTASELSMGKPVCADLQLGLATAPVLYASEQFPELNALIMRRFSRPGDIEMARDMVFKSNGVEHTMFLAKQHCTEAVQQVHKLEDSRPRKTLVELTQKILTRSK